MYRSGIKCIVISILFGSHAGCALHRDRNPHNDVLVFGTQTKFGADISAPLNTGTLPQINIGYNRAEAVWMPLRPNGPPGTTIVDVRTQNEIAAELTACDANLSAVIADAKDRNRACLATVLPNAKYVSMASGVNNSLGGADLEIDTYSVFASFGVRGNVSGSEASGGLAQFFATGIAAQRLGANPQVGAALNTEAPDAIAAGAKAAEAEAKKDQAVIEAEAAGKAAGLKSLDAQAPLITKIVGDWPCGDPQTDNTKFQAIVTDADTALPDASWTSYIGSAATKDDAENRLIRSPEDMQAQFLKSQEKICGGG